MGEKTARVKHSPQLPQQSLRRRCLLTSEHSNKNSMGRVYRSVTARSTVTPRATTLPRLRERTDSMVSCVTLYPVAPFQERPCWKAEFLGFSWASCAVCWVRRVLYSLTHARFSFGDCHPHRCVTSHSWGPFHISPSWKCRL